MPGTWPTPAKRSPPAWTTPPAGVPDRDRLTYLPVLGHRFARERLRVCTLVKVTIVKDRPEVLSVCVHNAGRSPMAAALLDHHAAGCVVVRSAGSQPADALNPAVVAAMNDLGLDLGRAFPSR